MAQAIVVGPVGSAATSPLLELLNADEIVPGSAPSYQTCKNIYEYHPLGKKMADAPVEMAISQTREIAVPKGPEERVVQAFRDEWDRLGVDDIIINVGGTARRYGIASCGIVVDSKDQKYDSAKPLDYKELWKLSISVNVWDPLNTAGSLVLSQDPNAADFQKHRGVVVAGQQWARNRVCVLMNEKPIYISFTSSAYGFVGRSVYQRALFPLKSFVQTMITDDLVSVKAGVIVAKIQQAGAIIT